MSVILCWAGLCCWVRCQNYTDLSPHLTGPSHLARQLSNCSLAPPPSAVCRVHGGLSGPRGAGSLWSVSGPWALQGMAGPWALEVTTGPRAYKVDGEWWPPALQCPPPATATTDYHCLPVVTTVCCRSLNISSSHCDHIAVCSAVQCFQPEAEVGDVGSSRGSWPGRSLRWSLASLTCHSVRWELGDTRGGRHQIISATATVRVRVSTIRGVCLASIKSHHRQRPLAGPFLLPGLAASNKHQLH